MSEQQATGWKFTWLTDWDVIENSNLDSATPFFHSAAINAWVETFGGRSQVVPSFLVAKKDDSEVVWPLVRLKTGWKQGYRRKLQPIGYRVYDYHDPIQSGPCVLDESFWAALRVEIQSQGATLCDTVEIPRIRNILFPKATISKVVDRAPYMLIDKFVDGEDFMKHRKASLRGDVRRQIRRLREHGEVEFRVYDADSLANVEEWIPDLESERKRRYPDSHLPPGFLRKLVRHGLSESVVHCSTICLNAKPISWHVGFTHRKAFYWYIPLFDAKYSNYSPGKAHLFFAIDWAIKNGFSVFDFLRGVESYKSGWTDGDEFSMFTFEQDTESVVSALRRKLFKFGNRLGYLKSQFGSSSEQ